MSTRGCFRVDGKDKLTYNHSDSYPEGLGQEFVTQVKALVKKHGLDGLRLKASALRLVDVDTKPTKADIDMYQKFSDTNVHSQTLDDWYCLLRDLQGDLAGCLEAGVMLDGNNFILDSLYCEYAYILNLDDGVIEFYNGFQEKPHEKGRYTKQLEREARSEKYYPCALAISFPINDIPKNWLTKVSKAMKLDEE
jgi:hypothetical protein